MNYIQLHFTALDAIREILIAQLAVIGFTAFEEGEEELIAGIAEPDYDVEAAAAIAKRTGVAFSTETLPEQNWNAAWESSFEPVIVKDFCTVRASFHPQAHDTPYEVIITPKMSFGTGHHATTRLMIEAMQGINLSRRSVLDFGTGTGILAILAAKLGATSVLAIDNDDWSVRNAEENLAMNGTPGIIIRQGSLEAAGSKRFDLILANINRHILLEYMTAFPVHLKSGGLLLLSGILDGDRDVIGNAAGLAGFVLRSVRQENGWLAMTFGR